MGKRITTADFIAKAKSVHGEKYNYSKTEYINGGSKDGTTLIIICPIHGEFKQRGCDHLRGNGCKKCSCDKRRKSPENFILQAKQVHGDKYDYSQTEYINSNAKVKIICFIHGEFWQLPSNHIKGQRCPSCTKNRKLDTQRFLFQAKQIHGDKYDYSQTEYINNSSRLKIICPIHGAFFQRAVVHLRGGNCPKCGYIQRSKSLSHDTQSFIKKALLVHGEKYDYSLSVYHGNKTPLFIICQKHGVFLQSPSTHLRGGGCIKCAGTDKKNIDYFIEKAKKVHKNKYDYSQSIYENAKSKVKIICPEHGPFWQVASGHLVGRGCYECAKQRISLSCKKSHEEFLNQAKTLHQNKYDYSQAFYEGTYIPIKIICPKHGEFWQIPTDHINGCGCKKCAKYGFNPQKPSIIYFLKLQTAIAAFWKIGITNRTVEDRFRKDYDLIQSGWIWHGDGEIIWNTEQQLLRQYQDYKLNYLFPLLQNGGDTECFTLDLPVKKIIKTISQKLKTPPEEIKAEQK